MEIERLIPEFQKVSAAQRMARHLTRERNRSSSFCALMYGIEAMMGDINASDRKPCRQAARSCGTIHSEIKQRIGPAWYTALKTVNQELVGLYRDIGRMIVERQTVEGWGKAVVEPLAADLQMEFPGVGGFSASSFWRMKTFFEAYNGLEKLASLVQEIA